MDNMRGWAFPIECNPLTGRIQEVSGEESVKQSIKMILNTNPGERFFYRGFGSGLTNFVFGLTNYTALKQVEMQVKESIEEWEKRISLISVKAQTDGVEKICIEINYQLKDNGTEFSYTHELEIR
jgi:phage baseplate assembly protein W